MLRSETNIAPTAILTPRKFYLHRCWENTREQWGGHQKVELGAGFIAAIAGSISGILYAGFNWAAFGAAILGACVGFLVGLLFIFLYYLSLSPKRLDEQRQKEFRELERKEQELKNEITTVRLELAAKTKPILPEIKCEVEEVHLHAKKPKSADVFIRLRLEYKTSQPTHIKDYVATLQIKGEPHNGYVQNDLHSYSISENNLSTDEYGDDRWAPIPMSETSLDDLRYALFTPGYPGSGWLHFAFPDLPYWPRVEVGLPVYNEQVIDPETGEESLAEYYTKEISTKTLEFMTITIQDIHRTNTQITVENFDHKPERIIRRIEAPVDQIREVTLPKFVELAKEGEEILRISAEDDPVTNTDAQIEAWERKASEAIEEPLGSTEKHLFLSNATLRQYPHEVINVNQRKRLTRIYTRLSRLSIHIKRLSS